LFFKIRHINITLSIFVIIVFRKYIIIYFLKTSIHKENSELKMFLKV